MKAHSKITANYASRAQGVHGSGSRAYQAEMGTRLLMILRSECAGPDNAKTIEALATRIGLNGRAIRQIVYDLEVSGQVLCGYIPAGIFVARTTAEAEQYTQRMESQLATMRRRVEARRKSASELVQTEAA